MLKVHLVLGPDAFTIEAHDGKLTEVVPLLQQWFTARDGSVSHTEISTQLTEVLSQGRQIMAQNAEVLAFLTSLNAYTNEIAADIDQLIADNALSPEVKAAMEAHSATLKALAAKSGDPLPPPVEPPPVA